MSSRFPPSSGYNSRDRSPPRFGDRRPPAGPRGPDDGSPSFGREPPRGPRALIDSPRGGHFGGGRGRGYGRGDFRDRDRDRDLRDRDRDRDFRDTREPPPFRRDLDRDWGRRDRDFDPRDTRMGFGRGRSRSPTRDFRDLRDLREPPGRDFDLVRMRRNSRDSLLSASSGGPDGPPSSGGHPRGGSHRGRGRGDWEGGRGRGRPPYLDDREPFRRRSRSRDPWRERGRDRLPDRDLDRRDRDLDRDRLMDRDRMLERERDRDIRERDRDRDMDRRDRFDRREDWDPRRPDRDDRDRPPEPWKRERPPSRADNRGSIGSTAASIAHGPPSTAGLAMSDRGTDQFPYDQSRKPSTVSGTVGFEGRRDSERPETTPFRSEPHKDLGSTGHQHQHSPPPSAPQVPAFGSLAAPIPSVPPAKASPADGPPINEPAAQPEKERTEASPNTPVHAPTGPKAERAEHSQPPHARARVSDAGPPLEEPVRTSKASTQLPERSPPTAPAAMIKRDSVSGPGQSNVPAKPNPTTTSPTFARLPPPPPRAISREPSISPRMQPSSIPTGPRAHQNRRPSLPHGPNKPNKPWTRDSSSLAPSAPAVNPKEEKIDDSGEDLPSTQRREEVAGPVSSDADPTEKTETGPSEQANAPSPQSPSTKLPIRSPPPPVPTVEATQGEEPSTAGEEDRALIPDFEQSSDEEDEENVLFTQEYLEERKQLFEKDMHFLRAEMPPSPLEDPTIVSLLLKIQLLGRIAHSEPSEKPPEPLPSVEEDEVPVVPSSERVVTFAPTKVDRDPEPLLPKTVAPPVPTPTVPHPEITLDALPFLHSGPPTPLSDLDVLHDPSAPEHSKEILRNELSKRQKEIARKNTLLRDEYMAHYKPWRLSVWELDRSKDKNPMTPGPVSPPPPAIPVTPAVIPEGREGRRYKGNSELDFLNALKASEISAQEELERRRTKMATARPDLAREAVIPDMLEPQEEKAQVYKDVNAIVETNRAMEVFGFLPPPNDFSKEEHEIFTDAFMAYPKKWGKIAEALPGRDFQQCIVHYYLTKEEIKYKAKLNRRWSRRGRNRPKSSRPKSNALIADLGVVKPDFDGEDEQPPQVTDTGRPRRAAAPTFGDATEAESAGNGRRTGQTEVIEKPVSRRGGRGGGVRGQRRARTAQQEPKALGPPPMGDAPFTAVTRMETGADGLIEGVLPQERDAIERDIQPPISRPRAGRGRAREGMYVFESTETETAMAPKASETGYGSLQPTSYWSVPEQRDFPRLLAHFGRDFEGISNFMKTKTTVMVKNYYQRRLDSGQRDFEEILLVAEEKKARGEPTGPLPVPSVAPKRRYEATPSAIVPRPLAPHGELMSEADDVRFPKGKPLALSPQPIPLHGRPLPDNERGSARYPPLAQASTAAVPSVAATLGDEARAMRTQTGPSRMPGPRLGYFADERRESSLLSHSNPRAQEMQIPSRHTPGAPMSSDIARMDPLSSQAYMSGQPPPLLPTGHSRHPSLNQAPSSPTQLPRPDLEISSVHRDPFAQRPYYSLQGPPVGLSQPPRPVLSPVKDTPRPSATLGAESTPRQVPAKRSNIMSILNDEPEEPQPRKRLASEQAPAAPSSGSASTPRSIYPPAGPSRTEEPIVSGSQKPSGYGHPSPLQTSSRGYSEYSNYGPPGGSGTPANNDWMARFDPRAQQSASQSQAQPPPPPQPSSRSVASGNPQSSFSPYASAASQASSSLHNIPVSSSAPTPPPVSQRPSYPNVFAQSTPGQATVSSSSRDLPSQTTAYRSGSPPPRASSVAYGSRPEQPHQSAPSSASIFGMSARQSGAYSPAAPSTPASAQPHGQSYQQHVQTLVNGSHQSHRSTPVSLSGSTSQYGHSTPPPPAQGGRSMPPLTTLGRSYTPPSALHPSMGGYAPPHPSASGTMPSLQQRPSRPSSLGEPPAAPTHQRVYSQGSTHGGMPGSLHRSSQPPR